MSNLTLAFRHDGEELIVLKALGDAYDRVLAQVEVLRSGVVGDDLAWLLALAEATDHAEDRRDKLRRRWCRVRDRLALDDDGLIAPEVMAHGCAVLDLGAGAPPMQVAGVDVTAHADPLFLGQPGQELPPGEGTSHTETYTGAITA